jgi:hypothetical protein
VNDLKPFLLGAAISAIITALFFYNSDIIIASEFNTIDQKNKIDSLEIILLNFDSLEKKENMNFDSAIFNVTNLNNDSLIKAVRNAL